MSPPVVAFEYSAKAPILEDPCSLALLAHLKKVAPSEANVLVIGQTGTGKEWAARQVHELSHRRNKPFIAVNCAAFAHTLVEAELFGHEKGAFTGATDAKPGWFEAANGGTLFLDEIGDMPLSLQAKLLRVLQEREVVRLGARRSITVDVRVVAATNIQLEQAIAQGQFREDLFYRLGVVTLRLAPLSERRGDILPLARHFMRVYSERLKRPLVGLAECAEARLLVHDWPGNVRELENVIHHALLLNDGQPLRASVLQFPQRLPTGSARVETTSELLQRAFYTLFEQGPGALHTQVQDDLLRTAYRFCQHNQVHTAELLGLSRNVVRAHLIRMGELVVNKRRGNGELARVLQWSV